MLKARMLIRIETGILSSTLCVFESDAQIMAQCWMRYLAQNQCAINVIKE